MNIVNKSSDSGLISMVSTVEDYEKSLKDLRAEAFQISPLVGDECQTRLLPALTLVAECKSGRRKFDFSNEEIMKSILFDTKDWFSTIVAKNSKTVKNPSDIYNVLGMLYEWKMEKFQHRAWDASMTSNDCEGLLFRLMERVSTTSDNIAVVQVFISIAELESCYDASIRIMTRVKDGLEKLKVMVDENVPLVGIARTQ